MRVAFLSPVPPAATGIADYGAEVLAVLAPRHEIDVFHGQRKIDRDSLSGSCAVHSADAFLRRHAAQPGVTQFMETQPGAAG